MNCLVENENYRSDFLMRLYFGQYAEAERIHKQLKKVVSKQAIWGSSHNRTNQRNHNTANTKNPGLVRDFTFHQVQKKVLEKSPTGKQE